MSTLTLPPDATTALAELEAAFPGRVSAAGEEPGGAVVCLTDTPLSPRWAPRSGRLWFLLPYNYPDAAIYPYYVTEATPTGGLLVALQQVTWRTMDAVQVSLRHNAWDPKVDTAVGSVLSAQDWLRTQ